MRRRQTIKRTDGFVGDLIREVLADEVEHERHDLHQELGRLAKGKYEKRNAPTYDHVEQTLALMIRDGEVAERYAPSTYDNERSKVGHTYFWKARR